MALVLVAVGLYLVEAGAAMPGAAPFGAFMLLFGGVVLAASLWKAAAS